MVFDTIADSACLAGLRLILARRDLIAAELRSRDVWAKFQGGPPIPIFTMSVGQEDVVEASRMIAEVGTRNVR